MKSDLTETPQIVSGFFQRPNDIRVIQKLRRYFTRRKYSELRSACPKPQHVRNNCDPLQTLFRASKGLKFLGWTFGTDGPSACAKATFERNIIVPRHKSASGRTTLKFFFM
jgi:hypothetical protein